MKLTKKKSAPKANKKPVAVKKKQSFDFKSFSNSINSLNKDNYGSAPIPVKIFLVIVLIVAIGVAAWFALISKKIEEIKGAEANQQALLDSYREKERKARHLDEYKAQVQEMELEFIKLLNQLPKDTRVSELTEGINMVGSGSAIRFQRIVAEPELEREFFIEQPIKITAVAGYHEFGSFITGIAALPRIITMHNFEIKNPQPSLDVMPELQLVLDTKTYRSKAIQEEQPAETPAEGGQ